MIGPLLKSPISSLKYLISM